MLNRTLVYVDTSYLLASFYNSWETGARAQLEIDLPEVVSVLGTMVSDQLKQPVHRQYWYDGIPDGGPHRYQRALRSEPLVQLRAGQLIEWGDRRTQKAVDTRLVADMVIAATKAQFSDIVLVSGDADMLPGVEEAINAGIRVHLYGFGWDSMSSQLRFMCDTTTILDPREDFKETMRLNILEGPLPPAQTGDTPTEPSVKPLGDAEPIENQGPCAIPDAVAQDAPLTPAMLHTAETNTDGADATSATPAVTSAPTASPAAEAPLSDATAPVAEQTVVEQSLENPDAATVEPRRPSPAAAGADAANLAASNAKNVNASPASASAQNTATPQATAAPAETATAPAEPASQAPAETPAQASTEAAKPAAKPKSTRPNPGMMARHRKLRSQYVPLPEEVWAAAGEQSPFDIGQQYASWWYDHAASDEQKDTAHLLTGGGLPPEIDRPLLQFACETLHEYTLTESQRVGLRDGFHSGIRGVMLRR